MTPLADQIKKLQQRLDERADPLLADMLKSLERLQALDTVEGLIEFCERNYCSCKDAAELTGINYKSIKQYVENYVHHPDSKRTKIPVVCIQEGTGDSSKQGRRTTYLIPRKALKGLKQPQKNKEKE